MTTQFRKFRAREDPITIVKFPFSSRQWQPPLATLPSLFSSLFRRFFLSYRWRRPHAPSLSSVVNGGGRDGRIITEPSRLCAEWHIGIHMVHAYTGEVEVFRAGIMASTHLRYLHTGCARKNDRSPPSTSSNVASDSPSPPCTETIRRLSSIWPRKERVVLLVHHAPLWEPINYC